MIPAEEEYLKLVGIEGHQKAANSLAVLFDHDVDESLVKLYYLTLTNTYWRGVNAVVDKARDVLNAKRGKVRNSGKSTN